MIFKNNHPENFPKALFTQQALDNWAIQVANKPKQYTYTTPYITKSGETLTICPETALNDPMLLNQFLYLVGQLAIYQKSDQDVPFESLIFIVKENPNTKKLELDQWTDNLIALKQFTILAAALNVFKPPKEHDPLHFPIFHKARPIEAVIHHEGKQRQFPGAHGED